MAYGSRYYFQWTSQNGTVFKIDVLQNGYSGAALQRAAGSAPLLRREKNGNICGTSLEWDAECLVDQEFADLYTTDPTEFQVVLYSNGTAIWKGYITPELYSEPVIAPPYDVHLTATDGLGELKLHTFASPGGTQSLSGWITSLLSHTGLSLNLEFVSTLQAASPTAVSAANLLTSIYTNLDRYDGSSCYDVLDALLASFHAFIVQVQGMWVMVRETDIENMRQNTTVYSVSGETFTIQEFGSLRLENIWPVGQLSQVVDPAKNSQKISAPNHWVDNLFTTWGQTQANCTFYAEGATVSSRGGLKAPFDLYQITSSGSATFTGALGGWAPDDTLTLRLRASSRPYVVLNGTTGEYRTIYAPMKVIVSVTGKNSSNATITRYLTSEGAFQAATCYAVNVVSVDAQLSAYKEFNLELPVADSDFASITSVTVTVTGGSVSGANVTYLYLCGCALQRTSQEPGWEVTTVLNNSARGAAEDVNVALADISETTENYYMVDNIAVYANYTRVVNWRTGSIAAMPYLEMLARDYCLSIATPRLRVEGKLNVPAGSVIPFAFRDSSLIYWPETFDWDLYNDEWQVSMLSLPAAAITVTSETREVMSGSAAGTTGGSTSGGSSGGSGSSGGGSVASSLGGLSDVTIASPADGQTLIYSSAAGGWVNAYGQLVKLSDVNISSPSNGQVLTYNSSTGKWVNATPASTGGDEVSLAAPVIQIYSGYSEASGQTQFSPYLQAFHPAKDGISGAQFVLMKWGRRRGRIGATSTKQYSTNRKGWGEARGGVHTEGVSFSDTYLLSNLRNFICQHYCVIYGSNTRPTWATLKATAKSTKAGFGGRNEGMDTQDYVITGHTKLFGVALRWENPEWTALGLTGTIEDSTCEVDGVKRWLYSDIAPLRVFVNQGKTYWSMGFSQDTSLYHYGMATRKQLEAVADEIGDINTLLAAI